MKKFLSLILTFLCVSSGLLAQNSSNYIRTDGTNYINTGYYAKSYTKAQCCFYKHSNTVGAVGNFVGIFGSEPDPGVTNSRFLVQVSLDGKSNVHVGAMGSGSSDGDMCQGYRYYVTLENGHFYSSHNSYTGTARKNSYWTQQAAFTMTKNTMWLGGVNGGRKSFINIYDFILYENNIEVRHFYPAKWNGVLGMYESKENKFYPKAAGNDFTGGISTSCPHTWNEIENDNSYQTHKHCHICDVKHTYIYKKVITYNPNGGVGSAHVQTIENSGTLRASGLYTRKNHIFYRWNTKDDGTGDVYAAYTTFTVNNSNTGTMNLYAIWNPVKFTLMNGSTQVAQVDAAETLTKLDDSNKPADGDKLFVGYFTEADGKGTQVYDGNLNPTEAGKALNFTSNTTLYAYFISDKHNVIFDYSFRTDENTYATLSLKAYNYRLQLKDASGAVLKTVYLTAPTVTVEKNVNDMTDNISTHTTSNMLVKLEVGTGVNVVSGSEATIYFATQAELEKVHSFQYDVWGATEAAGKSEHWETETNEGTNSTIFKYTGYHEGNMFTLSWTVTLHDLAMYPEKIYAKPMIKKGENTYAEISPMTGLDGLECLRKTTDSKTYATYTGEYAVLRTQGTGAPEYHIGMTGFYLDGSDYFLNETHGTVSDDFISSTSASNPQTGDNASISYDIYDYDIPVVLLLPAVPESGIDATVNYAKKILYVDQARAKTVNLSNFVAYRENFDFLGWYDTEWKENGKNKIWGANDVYEFHTHDVSHNGGTRTLIAQWTRSTAPVASVAMTEEANQFKYTITATDDVKVTAVKYLISDTEPAANAGWIDVTDNTVTIPRTNDVFGKYLYVMVENEGKNVIVKYNDPIRSFIDIKANPDPDSSVENMHWVGEEEKGNWEPDGTYSYTYYTTYYNSEKAYKIQNATAYKVGSISDRAINLTEITTTDNDEIVLPKGEAVLLKAYEPTITLEAVNTTVEKSNDNNFEGVDDSTEQSAGYDYYIFSYAQKGLGFYLNSSTTLAAHKAFIRLDNGHSAARAFTLNFGDSETTAIRDIETEADTDALYDLSGRKVSAPSAQGGIYIKGGKKIIIKK